MRKIILKTAVGLANLTLGSEHDRCPQRLARAEPQGGSVPGYHAVGDGARLGDHQPAQAAQDEIREVPVQIDYTEYSLAKGQSSLNSINILVDLVIGRFLK